MPQPSTSTSGFAGAAAGALVCGALMRAWEGADGRRGLEAPQSADENSTEARGRVPRVGGACTRHRGGRTDPCTVAYIVRGEESLPRTAKLSIFVLVTLF